jgi:hypothetical protein
MCNICGKGMVHLVNDLYLCPDCELISSVITADNTLYDKSYQRKYERYASTPTGKTLVNLRKSIVTGYGKGKVLDFGCGQGDFHKEFDNAFGFDINPFSSFCDVSLLFNNYDIVTFWDSLEHLNAPRRVIIGLWPKYIFVSTPCYDDFINGGDKKEIIKWHHYYPGEHIHYFNEKSLTKLLEACKYKIICKTFEESKYRTSGKDRNIITLGGERG